MKAWHLPASALAGIVLTLAVTGLPSPTIDGPNVEDRWDLVFAEVVTVSEMDRLAAGKPVYYQGSMEQWHYFRVGSSGYYRLRKAEATIPTHGFDGDGSSQLAGVFMTLTIEDGKLRADDLPAGSMGPARGNPTLTLPSADSHDG